MSLSPFELALKAGLAASRSAAGVAVTYTRSSTTLTIEKAIQGEVQPSVLPEDGAEAVVDRVDWFIAVSDLTLGVPAIGDLIARNIDGTTTTYTVESPGIGIPCFDFSDSGQTHYRIRTRKDGGSAFTITKPNGFDISGNEMRYD